MSTISAADFAALTPQLGDTERGDIFGTLTAAMERYEINTPRRVAHFLAQLLHESGSFHFRREIASGAAYEGRRDLGNTQPGDGRRFRGRGWLQITGRANYRTYGEKLDLPLEQQPELAETDANAALIACAYWDARKINRPADRDDLIAVTRAINGGLNGLQDRRAKLSRVRALLAQPDPDPSEDDAEHAIPLMLFKRELPFSGALQGGTTWAPLRLLADALELLIVEADGADATLSLPDGAAQTRVPLEIVGGRGWSPVRAVASAAGLMCRMEAGRVWLTR